MYSVLAISDIVLDPLVKEIKEISNGEIVISHDYSEDLVLRIISFNAVEADMYDVVFVHSDQQFHLKDQQWQKSLINAVNDLALRLKNPILISNAFSVSFTANPMKSSLGVEWDMANIYGNEIQKLLANSNVFIFDFLQLCMNLGKTGFYNYNLGHLYQMPYTKAAIKSISSLLVNEVNWLFTEEKKVIVLDCDNTLWKGVVGEEGVNGIKCNKNAEGILYYNFQLFLKAKKEEGYLLAICSKNNEEDVKEAFEKNHFPLTWLDFTVKKINWLDKIDNIKSIAKELNVGTDSFVFVDDNLFELNSVKELVKGVSCLQLTSNYSDLLMLTNSFLFRRKQILKADREKSLQYAVEQLRKEEETGFLNIEDFIKNLEIKIDIRLNDKDDIERLAQMTGKTNQFNFNKHSYSTDELQNFIDKKNRIYSLKMADKYGDYGTVGLILIEIADNKAVMENYLMSCRALGKKIEFQFYNEVLTELKKDKIDLSEIRFVENDKNIPAQDFLKQIKT